jgi:aminoacrylate hydrolase
VTTPTTTTAHREALTALGACQTPLRAEWTAVRMAYNTTGPSSPGEASAPVLLIMGYTVPGSAWLHQIPALAQRHRVAWYDHRGCGDTRADSGVYSMALLASDALRLLDHLGWDSAHIVGVSMGGMVAQELALRCPDRVRSLSLIATHAGGLRNRLPPLAGLSGFVRANIGPRSDRMRNLERLLFPDAFLASCDRPWLDQVLANDFGRPIPAKYRLSQLAAVMRHDTRDRLHRLSTLPTLVVKPALDKLVSPEACERLSWLISGARLKVYPEAGHGVIRQCADRLNADLLGHFHHVDAQA